MHETFGNSRCELVYRLYYFRELLVKWKAHPYERLFND